MPTPTRTLNDSHRIPALGYGTGTAFYAQSASEPVLMGEYRTSRARRRGMLTVCGSTPGWIHSRRCGCVVRERGIRRGGAVGVGGRWGTARSSLGDDQGSAGPWCSGCARGAQEELGEGAACESGQLRSDELTPTFALAAADDVR